MKESLVDQSRSELDELKKLTEQRVVAPEPPQFPISPLQPDFQAMENARRTALGYAEVMHKKLMAQIADFEKGLTNEEEVGGYLASFGRQLLIHIEQVTYRNPYLIVFHGKVEKTAEKVQLVQHTAQLNVLFVAVPKEGPLPRRIGFGAPQR
jgi:hypothetical protein